MPLAYIVVWAVICGLAINVPLTIGIAVGKPFPLTWVLLPIGGILLGPIGGILAGIAGWFVAAAIAPGAFLYGILDAWKYSAHAFMGTLQLYNWSDKLKKPMYWLGAIAPGAMIAISFVGTAWWYGFAVFFATPGWWAPYVLFLGPFYLMFLLTYKWHKEWISMEDFTPASIGKLAFGLYWITGVGVAVGYISIPVLGLMIFGLPLDLWVTIQMFLAPVERYIWALFGTAIGTPLLLALKKAGIPKPAGAIW
ncbi:MAG: hypothetical protein ACXACA_01330 [Candidatus Ranarchaeia archaeon]|jgi:hypothetical protein